MDCLQNGSGVDSDFGNEPLVIAGACEVVCTFAVVRVLPPFALEDGLGALPAAEYVEAAALALEDAGLPVESDGI